MLPSHPQSFTCCIIDNVLEVYKSIITISFNSSPKKEKLLKHISYRKTKRVGMCKTRWSERDVSYKHFNVALSFIVVALEIINGIHTSMNTSDEIFTKGW